MSEDPLELAGYRVVRRLGSGRRADVYLGAPGGDGSPVAVKVFRPEAAASSVAAEVAIVSACSAPALPAFRDVCSSPSGLCLVSDRASGPTLARWLADRPSVPTGELVTVCAAIVQTVASLHAAGWARVVPATSAVRFDGAGRPVVTSFGTAVQREGGAPGVEARRDDVRTLAVLIDEILLHDAGGGQDLGRWLAERASTRPFTDPLPEAEELLFRLAVPAAVGWSPGRRPPAEAVEAAMAPRSTSARIAAPDDVDDVLEAHGGGGERRGPVRLLSRAVSSLVARAGGIGRVLRHLRGRRRLVLIGGAAAIAMAATAIAVLPPAASPARPGAVDTETTGAAGTAVPAPPATAPVRPMTTGTPSAATSPVPSSAADGAVAADDPVAAAAVLLNRRQDCLRQADAGCLDLVDQAGSPLAGDDAAAISGEATARLLPPEAAMVLVERTGDAAILTMGATAETQPASLLLMKGEAGWRLREVFDG